MAIGDVWGNSWGSSWGDSWALAAESTETPAVVSRGSGGGYWTSWEEGWKRRKKWDDTLESMFQDAWREITGETDSPEEQEGVPIHVKAKAAEIKAEFAKAAAEPQAGRDFVIDWREFARDVERVGFLLREADQMRAKRLTKERRLKDRNAVLILLMV